MSIAQAKVSIGAIDKITRTLDKVKAKFPELSRGVRRSNAAFKVFQGTTEKFRKSLEKVGGAMQDIGRKATLGITLPVVAATGFSVKAFADYETALVGVGKTSNLSGAELQAMGEKFRGLSKEIPVSVEELLGLGQTAAQLGVSGSDNILKFSSTLAKLSRASDVTGEEGAAQLARFIKVTGGTIDEVDRFASTLVELGNTSAATEGEILSFSSRLGAATAVFNVGGTQALALATTLKSIGIESEAGSSSVQRAMGAINESISKGGQKMQVLSKLTGIATKDLKEKFKNDAVGTLKLFAEGLNKVEKAGGDVTQAMEFFGLTGVRDIQVLGSLAKNTDLLDEKLNQAAKAFKENTALEKEFAAASKTLNNEFQLMWNDLKDLAITVGAKVAPVLSKFFQVVRGGLNFLRNNPTIATMVVVLIGLAAVLGPIIFAFGTLLVLLPSLITGWGLFSAVMAGFGITSWAALLPILIIIAKFILIGALIVGLIALIWKFRKAIMDGLVSAFEWVAEKVQKVIGFFGDMMDKFKSFLGLGGDAEQKAKIEATAQPGGGVIAPSATDVGGQAASQFMNQEFLMQTNNARVDINVRAPESTFIKGESQNGVMSINRGLAGAF